MEYFKYFPTIKYFGYNAKNILVRSKIRELVLKNSVYLFDYTIQDSDRADIIADREYGHSRYAWIIYYANNIIDPLTQWPMNYADFNRYLAEKYGSVELALSTPHHYLYKDKYIIDEFAYNENSFLVYTPDAGVNFNGYTVGEQVELYKNGVAQEQFGVVLSSNKLYTELNTDFVLGSGINYFVQGDIGSESEAIRSSYYSGDLKKMISCYDYETDLNDEKRKIKLIRSGYVAKIADEFKKIF